MTKKIFLLYIGAALFLCSCARVTGRNAPVHPAPTMGMPSDTIVNTVPGMIRSEVIHEVAPGETLWRISRMYDVKIEDIAQANNLANITQLEKGQKLIVPNAAPIRSVIPLYPSNMWKYIIVHHSATDVGKALTFDHVHLHKRLWRSGLGYHFVIDNGTSDTTGGHIEVSPRWLHQEYGAHCKAGEMNYKGIGICLVGNFNEEDVLPAQIESLVYLVNTLKRYYSIPNSNILGHGQVKGAATDCPGRNFPWVEFHSRLDR